MPTNIPVGPIARNRIYAFLSGGEPPAVQVFSPVTRTSSDIDALKIIVTLCGAGLLVSLLFATYGADLSLGFF
jgi:hypothetical protein